MAITYSPPETSVLTSASQAAAAHATAASTQAIAYAKEKFDDALVRYDAWFLVFVAVLMGLGLTMLAGMAAWCVVNRHGRFSGEWNWSTKGVSVNMECV